MNAPRTAEQTEQRPSTLPLSAPKLPSDLFAFPAGSAWDLRAREDLGVQLEREAVYKGRRCTLVAETFRDSYANESAGVGLNRAYLSVLTEAGYAEIRVDEREVSLAIDQAAGEAIEDWQGELEEAWGDC